MDCKFISKVAKLVPVIPVLAKADSMTSGELQAFRKQVGTSLLKARLWPCEGGSGVQMSGKLLCYRKPLCP